MRCKLIKDYLSDGRKGFYEFTNEILDHLFFDHFIYCSYFAFSRRGMNSVTRTKILNIADGQMETLPLLHAIYNIRLADPIFDYLIKNGITGKKLLEFFHIECKSSLLMAKTSLCRAVLKDKSYNLTYQKDVLNRK